MRQDNSWFRQEQAREGGQPRQADTAPPPKAEKEKDGGTLGCVLLILYFVLLIASIVLAIVWDCPTFDEPVYTLWDSAKLPWMIGLILGPVGWFVYNFEKASSEGCDTPVTATITDIEVREESTTGAGPVQRYNTYRPMYTYCLNGETIQVRSRRNSSNKNKYQIGQQRTLLVSPGEPDKYCIPKETKWTLWLGRIMLLGVPLAVIGLIMWIASVVMLLANGLH